jgi:hypothetical protein
VTSVALVLGLAGPASAYEFARTLSSGDSGPDVKALQVRVAGWYPANSQDGMSVDGDFGAGTAAAVKAFQEFYGLAPDGIAGPSTFAVLAGLEDEDGSTQHFDWSEFWQKSNSRCSAKANAYSGTFGGGMVAPLRAKKNVKRLMWRLEALRAKAGGKAIGINSAFRSVSYNDCIGGARASQHMYGTAVDNRMAEVTNRYERDLARASQFHGIGCYSSLSHNHFDIRLENPKLPGSQYWWWPEQDRDGRDLADDGAPCWGESSRSAAGTDDRSTRTTAALLPSERFLSSFTAEGEWYGGRGD